MASELEVTTIRGLSSGANANKINIPSSQTLHVPGHVMQVASSGAFQTVATITSTSWTGTGHTVAITTKSDNAKILLNLAGGGWYDQGNGTQSQWLSFYRLVSGGSYTQIGPSTYGLQRMSGDGNTWNIKPHSIQWLDSPAQNAGTLLTYQVYARVSGASSDYNSTDRGAPVLVAMEIAQ